MFLETHTQLQTEVVLWYPLLSVSDPECAFQLMCSSPNQHLRADDVVGECPIPLEDGDSSFWSRLWLFGFLERHILDNQARVSEGREQVHPITRWTEGLSSTSKQSFLQQWTAWFQKLHGWGFCNPVYLSDGSASLASLADEVERRRREAAEKATEGNLMHATDDEKRHAAMAEILDVLGDLLTAAMISSDQQEAAAAAAAAPSVPVQVQGPPVAVPVQPVERPAEGLGEEDGGDQDMQEGEQGDASPAFSFEFEGFGDEYAMDFAGESDDDEEVAEG